MRINKREFLAGTSILGMASLVGGVSSRAAEQSDGRRNSVFNVLDFGAKGDGKTPDSESIQKALDVKEMTADLGEHGADYVFINNVGSVLAS